MKKIDIKLLKKKGDLLIADHLPVISHFTYEDRIFFYLWCDMSKEYNIWLVFEVKNISDYFLNKKSLKYIINQNETMQLVYVDDNIDIIKIIDVSYENLPDMYKPSSFSVYDEKYFTKYAEKLRKSL